MSPNFTRVLFIVGHVGLTTHFRVRASMSQNGPALGHS